MLKKSFVSIAFSSKRLQVLQLNSSKKKVVKHATVELPEGLITYHRVQDKVALASLLKSVWKKYNIKEKSVGIVVPEFSTFTKLLSLPMLQSEELGEAVEWQAHDFLPKKVKEMSMDWKIVQQLEGAYQVLVVAMDEEVLQGYVDAVGLAGLFPMVVETPALSLVRVGDKNLPSRLIIYEYFDETILIVADKHDVVGSSVIASKDAAEITKTADKIIKHYNNIKVEGVLIGGISLNHGLTKTLNETLKLPVGRLKADVDGLTEVDIQAYLVPTSLQYKKPTEPKDETTINLLPRKVVEKYKSKRLQVQTWSLMMIATFLIWSSFLVALGTYVFISQQSREYEKESGTHLNVISKTEEARNTIKKINRSASMVIKIDQATIYPQTVFNEIAKSMPSGVVINSYKMELDKGEIELKGVATERSDLLSFKQNLEENENFSDVSIPIAVFEVESNLRFDVSFNLAEYKSKGTVK